MAKSGVVATGPSPKKGSVRAALVGLDLPATSILQDCFKQFGIQTVFTEPVERSAALKIVRATHLLVVHEFRRYVRVPVAIDVRVEAEGQRFSCTSQEISAGGMSLKTTQKLALGKGVEVAFDLPGMPQVRTRGAICWLHPNDSLIGVRFDVQDARRVAVKQWIENYLEII